MVSADSVLWAIFVLRANGRSKAGVLVAVSISGIDAKQEEFGEIPDTILTWMVTSTACFWGCVTTMLIASSKRSQRKVPNDGIALRPKSEYKSRLLL